MIPPGIKFNVPKPLSLRNGERTIIKMTIIPNGIGTCRIRLFLKASTCALQGGKKEIKTSFEVTELDESREVEVKIALFGQLSKLYRLKLFVSAKNGEGGDKLAFLPIRLNAQNPISESEQTVQFDEQEEITEVVIPIPAADVEDEPNPVISEPENAPVIEENPTPSSESEIVTDTDTNTENTSTGETDDNNPTDSVTPETEETTD